MLLRLPDSDEATAVPAAMEKAIKTLRWERGEDGAPRRHQILHRRLGLLLATPSTSPSATPTVPGNEDRMRTPVDFSASYSRRETIFRATERRSSP